MGIDKKNLLKEMGNRYYTCRKALGLTQEQTAEIADVTQQAISDSELGKSFLAVDAMLRISDAYNVSCDYLITGKISQTDYNNLNSQISSLDEAEFIHLKAIIEHYIQAVHKDKINTTKSDISPYLKHKE